MTQKDKCQCMTSLSASKPCMTRDSIGIGLQREDHTNKQELLPMRNTANLQIKPSIIRALRHNTCVTQEPISSCSSTKHVVHILDAKYEKAYLPAILRGYCSHLQASDREMLLSMLLKFELLLDGTLGDWNLPPVSFESKEGISHTMAGLSLSRTNTKPSS
jgi:hypothetical protein